jgi:Vault protein inter-alpha-trypsin domain
LIALFVPLSSLQAASNPVIKALEDGVDDGETPVESKAIVISDLKTDLRVHGRFVEVTLEAVLTNTTDDTMEAHFELALPDDAVITGYALDVEGTLIDGTLIDQPKARAVYEDEVRKGIDPGLAEVTSGNLFRTRVYPVPEEGSRTIRIRFVAPVDAAKGFTLPIATLNPVGKFVINVEVDGYKSPPVIELPTGTKLALTKQGGNWRGTVQDMKGRKLNGAIRITAASTATPMLISRHANGRDYFQIGDIAKKRKDATSGVGRVRIYWDSSLSRRDDLLAEEMALLRAYLEAAKPGAIDIVSYSTGAPAVARFSDGVQAAQHLGQISYRGGTSFRGLDDLKLDAADQCLLFSDGAATLDTDAEFRPDCRLSVITSVREANGVKLGRIARATRGQFLRLTKDNGAGLLARLMKPAITVVDARDDGGRRLPFRALEAPDGGWLVVGRMPDYGQVHLLITGLSKGVSERIYEGDRQSFAKSNAAGAIWAAERVEQLADNPLKREEMRAIALSHQVASPTMAFLVLESVSQYLSADIKPPVGFSKEWMEEYREAQRDQAARKKEARAERLSFVVERWAERKEWWNTKFVVPARARKPQVQNEAAADAVGAAADAAAPAAAAPPAPRAPRTSSAVWTGGGGGGGDEEGYGEIVVTASRRDNMMQEVPVAVTAMSSLDASGKVVEVKIADVLSDQPYLKALNAAASKDRLRTLADQEKIYGSLPAFYLETSEWFRLKGDGALAEALLLSALELPIADDETRQIVAFRLQRAGALDQAIRMLELIAISTDFRPQPKRALALALAERGRSKGSAGRADLERAFKLLTDVVLDPAITDFDGIESIALMEANALIPAIEAAGGTWALDGRLVALLDTDVRIVIEWTNDDADIDLWVIEPTGEQVYYSNQLSEAGGQISNDMTDGYGPEEYLLRRAIAGEYRVKINGYSGDRLNPNGSGRVMVRMIQDFARPAARETLVDADISFERDSNQEDEGGHLIATMKVDKAVNGRQRPDVPAY